MTEGLLLNGIDFIQGDFQLKADLSLPRGEMACLLGPSGSGKTTILRLIAGFETPLKGCIRVNGKDITEIQPHKRKLGIVFQDYALFPHMTVAENITYGLRADGSLKNEGRKRRKEIGMSRVRELLELVRLPNFEDRKIASLSGGEKQRIALARALAPKPDLLLLDEPLSALDVQLRSMLRREIKRIQEALNLTTLYITHDQEEALALADSMYIMKEGRIIESGTPEKLYASPDKIFTGSFLGISNILRGAVQMDGENHPVFKIGNQSAAFGSSTPVEEGEARLFFRPEDCTPADNNNVKIEEIMLSGTILQVEYRGSAKFVLLEVEKNEVKLLLKSDVKVKKGEVLSFLLPRNKGLIFPPSTV